MRVGIQELEARLSEYVKRAARGEHFLVTDRGKPVARLVSLRGSSVVDRGMEEGWITPPLKEGLEPIERYQASRTTSEVLDEDRGSPSLWNITPMRRQASSSS